MKKLLMILLVVFMGVQAGNIQTQQKSFVDKAKFFLSTKEGKIAVGAIGLMLGGGTAWIGYYCYTKSKKTAEATNKHGKHTTTSSQQAKKIKDEFIYNQQYTN